MYLLRAEVGVGLPYFARPPLDDCIAEHSDDHDKQEVARVHQVQVDEGTVVLVGKSLKDINKYQSNCRFGIYIPTYHRVHLSRCAVYYFLGSNLMESFTCIMIIWINYPL